MRKKQLFALLMAGALSVGMAPTATFAADTAAETSAEGELGGELDSADTEEPSEDPAETPEEPAEDPAETPEDPAETPAETTADPTEAPTAEETDEQAAEAGSAIVIGGDSFTSLEKAFAAVPDCEDMINGEPACHLYRIIYFYRQPWKDFAIQQFSGKNHGRKGNTYCCSCQSDYEQCSRCASFIRLYR